MQDKYNREINYMRISVTDRCNLHCRFCMPADNSFEFAPQEDLLDCAEIKTIVRCATELGMKHYRITGGEPLVRKDIVRLIAGIREVPGIESIRMTTNGILLAKMLPELITAGLDGVNISLCSMDASAYERITGGNRLKEVLKGIEAAVSAGLQTKVNCVPIPGENTEQLTEIALLAKEQPIQVRFIEMMPIGQGSGYHRLDTEVVLAKLEERFGAAKRDTHIYGNGPAVYYSFDGFRGNIGFISAGSCKFCSQCNRVRLTADGRLKLCLQYADGVDLRKLLRTGEQERLCEVMQRAIYEKPKEHAFSKAIDDSMQRETRYMAQIGG